MKNRKNTTLPVKAVLIILALGCAAFAYLFLYKKGDMSRPQSELKKPSFVVGTAAGYAPFVSINAQGDYEGFDIDIAQALADKLGKKLEIKDLGSMTPLFMALEQDSIDAIIWGLSITQERLKKVAMVRYQGETVTEYSLLFWDTIPAEIATINDMAGMSVSVEPTSSQETVLNNYPLVNKLYVDRIDDALLNIQYGKSDAALVEPTIAKKFQKKYPNIKILPVQLAPQDQVHGIGVTLKKENNDLIQQAEQAVIELRENGTIKNLETKWGIA